MATIKRSANLRNTAARERNKYAAPKSLSELMKADGSFHPILPALFLQAFVWIDQCLQENMDARGLPVLSRMESQVLTIMAAGVSRPVEVAKALGVSRQTLNQNIRLLQGRGLVKLNPDPTDGRCKILDFSTDGILLNEAAINIIGHAEDELCRRIGLTNVKRLKDILDKDFGDIPIFETPS